jgi:acetyl esterase/lipase
VLEEIFPAQDRHLSQPVYFVQGGHPPMLLAVSVDDRVVDPGNTERMATRLRGVGSPVHVLRYRRLGHVLILGVLGIALRPFAPLLRELGRFIDQQAV